MIFCFTADIFFILKNCKKDNSKVAKKIREGRTITNKDNLI